MSNTRKVLLGFYIVYLLLNFASILYSNVTMFKSCFTMWVSTGELQYFGLLLVVNILTALSFISCGAIALDNYIIVVFLILLISVIVLYTKFNLLFESYRIKCLIRGNEDLNKKKEVGDKYLNNLKNIEFNSYVTIGTSIGSILTSIICVIVYFVYLNKGNIPKSRLTFYNRI